MGRHEFITEVRARRFYDGKTKKYYTTLYVLIPKELRDFFKKGQKVRVIIESYEDQKQK